LDDCTGRCGTRVRINKKFHNSITCGLRCMRWMRLSAKSYLGRGSRG
jgi:hypothetical protein